MTGMDTPQGPAFAEWCIVELFGHRRLAGYVTETQIAGEGFLRLDVPDGSGEAAEVKATQLYRPAAVYCLTPTDEATARAVAATIDPAPVQRWELPAAASPREPEDGEYGWEPTHE